MKFPLKFPSLCALILLAGCEQANDVVPEPEISAPAPAVVSRIPADVEIPEIPPLEPLSGLTTPAPDPGTPELVYFVTDAGDFIVAVYPPAAPNAAARFLRLVDIGFYDDVPVSRVVPGFVAQFGINWRADYQQWRDEKFDDDPSRFSFAPGTLAFAKAGPNTNATQVFINYVYNDQLASPELNFAVFGQVIQGMEVVNSFRAVGDPRGGLDQTRLWGDGAAYLDSLPEQPNRILEAGRIALPAADQESGSN